MNHLPFGHVPADLLRKYSMIEKKEIEENGDGKKGQYKREILVIREEKLVGTFKTKADAKGFIMAHERRMIRQRLTRGMK